MVLVFVPFFAQKRVVLLFGVGRHAGWKQPKRQSDRSLREFRGLFT